jgi:hypothetical protein
MTLPSRSEIPGRQCGDCAMCCHLGEIPGFKPYNQWCQYCSSQRGCDIYETRPQACRTFFCHYLISDLGEEWAPPTCGMVVAGQDNPPRLTILVDPERPDIWREAPYFSQIRFWSQHGAVTVMIGDQAYAVTPQRIEDLGLLTPEYTIEITEQETISGMRYETKRVLATKPVP